MDQIEQQPDSLSMEGMHAARPSLLSLLIEEGVASEGELRLVAAESMGAGVRLGEALLQRGWVDEPGLGRLLARQWNLPFVEEGTVDVSSAADDALAGERARELRAFCARAENGSLRALVSDPSSDQLNELRHELGDIAFAVVTDRDLRRLLGQLALSNDSEAERRESRAAELLTDLGGARERLEELHGRVAEMLRVQEAAARERAELEAELDQHRSQHLADQHRIRDLEHQYAEETQRHRQLLSQLAQLTETHTADS